MRSASAASLARPAVVLRITAAAGLLAAAAELVITGIRKAVFGEMVWTGWQTVWTTPASWLLFMVPPGLALAAIVPLLPDRWGSRLAVFAPALVAAFGVGFIFYPSLHPAAILLVAAGLAARITSMAAARADAAARFTRRVVVAGVAAGACGAVLVHGGRFARERLADAALPAATPETPNILLVVLDAVRATNLGLYGYRRPTTPALDILARRGTLFLNAYATAPWTLPSHATMFTGLYHHQHRADWLTPLEAGVPTLAGTLSRRGYVSGGFVANVAYASRETGLARGFQHYEDYVLNPGELLEASALARLVANNPRVRTLLHRWDAPGRRRVGDITTAFLRWQARHADRPFFAFLNVYDAHEPYLPPPGYEARAQLPSRDHSLIRMINARLAERIHKERMTPAERAAEEAAYDASIMAIDDGLKSLFETLERRGLMERTVVVITSDHGEQFGEHELFSHGNGLFRPALHVPLLIVDPRRASQGERLEKVVSLRDVPATVLALAGVAGHDMPGRSLLEDAGPGSPALAEIHPAPNQDPRYPSARGTMRSLVADAGQYVREEAGAEQLYAAADSTQTSNVIGDAKWRATAAALRARMDSLLRVAR